MNNVVMCDPPVHDRPAHVNTTPAENRPRFLSEADCQGITQYLASVARGGGETDVRIWSYWTGHVRWARNQITTSGDVRNNYIHVRRNLRGTRSGTVAINETTDAALVAAARRAERLALLESEKPEWELLNPTTLEPALAPQLFSETTYQLDADHRAAAAIQLATTAASAGVLSAGYIEVAAHSIAMLDSQGRMYYRPYTQASYSVTVRDPHGHGSGWAGVDWNDWGRIDPSQITERALDKCLRSRNPVAVEPGRYTTILEPQAVCDFVWWMIGYRPSIDRVGNEDPRASPRHPFFKMGETSYPYMLARSRLGEQVVDPRITISADPMDPDLGFPPFSSWAESVTRAEVYHPATWITNGVLTALAYNRQYAVEKLAQATGLPNEGAFRMSGGETSIDEMITTTKRGLLVTRFDQITLLDLTSLLLRGYTRDGLWLIENGKISKAVKNMAFTESPLFALNNLDQLGVPQRVYHPATGRVALPQPVVVPPIKVRDFSFTALSDAV
jgi:predicted Zn-dependent protease